MIYPYNCDKCETYMEVEMTMSEYDIKKTEITCPACDEKMKRVYAIRDFHVKMGVCGNAATGYYDWVYHYCEGNNSLKNKGSNK